MGATAEDKRTYTINDLRAILGIGRTSAQRLVHTGKFRSVRVGGSIRIVKSSFDAWMKTGDGQSYLSGLQGAKGNGSDCPRKHNPGSASSKIAENDEFNAEYGAEVNKIDAEVAEKKRQDRKFKMDLGNATMGAPEVDSDLSQSEAEPGLVEEKDA